MYIVPGPKSEMFLLFAKACVKTRFPKRRLNVNANKSKKTQKPKSSPIKNEEGWMSTKKNTTTIKKKSEDMVSSSTDSKSKKLGSSSKRQRKIKKNSSKRVIEILASSSSSSDEHVENVSVQKKSRLKRMKKDPDVCVDSDTDIEF